jgi:ArsR family transcriptional regulator, arsenate/arsenite/antimonite-responsive transcriptional repressor
MIGPMDDTMRALADPTRREILRALRAGDLSAGDIAARFDMTAPSISHHLNVLKDAGLVSAERDGRHIIYSLNSTTLQDLMQELLEFVNVRKSK